VLAARPEQKLAEKQSNIKRCGAIAPFATAPNGQLHPYLPATTTRRRWLI
jgi:hypothetical protein